MLLATRFITEGSASIGVFVITVGEVLEIVVSWSEPPVSLPKTACPALFKVTAPRLTASPPTDTVVPTKAPITKLPVASSHMSKSVSKTSFIAFKTMADSPTSCSPSLPPRIPPLLRIPFPTPGKNASTAPIVETFRMLLRRISAATKATALSASPP